MRKLTVFAICALLLSISFIYACSDNNNHDSAEKRLTMQAKITQITSEYIQVDIIKDEYNSGVMLVLVNSKTPITDQAGKSLSISNLEVNDIIEVEYSGQVMLSYPAKINAIIITLLG